MRGSDGSSASSALPPSANPDANHTYVGAMVYTAGTTSVPLYPLLQLALPAPTVGSHGVLQGQSYSVRLTFGDTNSQCDILDSTQTIVDSNISVPNPKPTDNSTPQQGDLYFGSFIGGSNEMTVWSVPVFLTVAPSQLPGAGFNGNMTLNAQASGVPGYQLKITDSSLFVYSNINIDNSTVGSVSQAQADTARIGLQTAQAQEPMQMYSDTNHAEMTGPRGTLRHGRPGHDWVPAGRPCYVPESRARCPWHSPLTTVTDR